VDLQHLRSPQSTSQHNTDASRSKPICLTAPNNHALTGPRTSESTAAHHVEGDILGNDIDLGLGKSLSVVEFTACMAHVVSFLVDERVRGMRGGVEADARDVGKMMDMIPSTHRNSKMAAALALGERSVLESWRAAWNDFRDSLQL